MSTQRTNPSAASTIEQLALTSLLRVKKASPTSIITFLLLCICEEHANCILYGLCAAGHHPSCIALIGLLNASLVTNLAACAEQSGEMCHICTPSGGLALSKGNTDTGILERLGRPQEGGSSQGSSSSVAPAGCCSNSCPGKGAYCCIELGCDMQIAYFMICSCLYFYFYRVVHAHAVQSV